MVAVRIDYPKYIKRSTPTDWIWGKIFCNLHGRKWPKTCDSPTSGSSSKCVEHTRNGGPGNASHHGLHTSLSTAKSFRRRAIANNKSYRMVLHRDDDIAAECIPPLHPVAAAELSKGGKEGDSPDAIVSSSRRTFAQWWHRNTMWLTSLSASPLAAVILTTAQAGSSPQPESIGPLEKRFINGDGRIRAEDFSEGGAVNSQSARLALAHERHVGDVVGGDSTGCCYRRHGPIRELTLAGVLGALALGGEFHWWRLRRMRWSRSGGGGGGGGVLSWVGDLGGGEISKCLWEISGGGIFLFFSFFPFSFTVSGGILGDVNSEIHLLSSIKWLRGSSDCNQNKPY